eukprot:2827448-Amphidinium_carterae.1
MGSARAPFRLTMSLASCFLHQPSARNLGCLSGKNHPTLIRAKGRLRGSIEPSSHTSGPSKSVWPST